MEDNEDISEGRLCDICGKPFTDSEWDNRHWGHKPGCKGHDCDYDLEYHDYCCPVCNKMNWAQYFLQRRVR